MSVIINRTNAQGFWATIFWYEHVYFAKSANILLYWQYISLEIQEFKRIITENFLSIQHQWNNLKTSPAVQF